MRLGWFPFVVGAFLLSFLAHAGPVFKIQDPGTIVLDDARVGVDYRFDLMQLLSDPGVPPRSWTFRGAQKPAWLRLDPASPDTLIGRPGPNDAGVFTFKVDVGDATGEGGEFDRNIRIRVLAPPAFTQSPIDLGIANEDKEFTFDLNKVVNSNSVGPFTFDAVGLPAWLQLDKQTGILKGTPKRADVKNYTVTSFTVIGAGGETKAPGKGTVVLTPHPPYWVKKEIEIEDAFEDAPYIRKLAEFAVNPDPLATPLQYDLVSTTLPRWVNVGKNSGELTGTPAADHVGPVSVVVKLSAKIENKVYDDVATFKFKVVHVNHAPEWLSNPIDLNKTVTKALFERNLSGSAKDKDIPKFNDALRFEIVSFGGPGNAWATLDPTTGKLSGTPQTENVGTNTWVVRVTDLGGLSAETSVTLLVEKANEPPQWQAHPAIVLKPDAKEDQAYTHNLAQYASDPDGDAMEFKQLDGPTWFTITPGGMLIGTPDQDDVGPNRFKVRVTDNKSGADVTEFHLFVEKTNHAPYWTQDPIVITVKEDAAINESIAKYAKDKDLPEDRLFFSAIEGPPWATLSPEGVFTGTPTHPNLGENKYKVRVSDLGGLTADVWVVIKVLPVNHAPYWEQDPIVLGPAFTGKLFTASVAPFAKDIDLPNDSLTFSKLPGGPAWVVVSSTGEVSGTPSWDDAGVAEFRVRVMDKALADAVAVVRIRVDKVNRPPYWRQNPILLPDATQDTEYSFHLLVPMKYADDPDNDPLKFTLVSGPAWMFVGEGGDIRGVPLKEHVGTGIAIELEVADVPHGLTARTKAIINVLPKNRPPVVKPNILFEVKEDVPTRIRLTDPPEYYVSDPDGDAVACELEDTADWVKLAPDCTLTLNALYAHVRPEPYEFRFRANDTKATTHGKFQVKVLRNPSKPLWLEDPIRMTARANELFTNSVAGKAKELDGIRLTFKKESGPAWLSIDSDGNLSGTPKDSDIGGEEKNTFMVAACNDLLCASARLIVTVVPGTETQTEVVGTLPGKAEYLWVIDNSSHCDKTIKQLRQHARVFFDTLTAQSVTATGIYLSADAKKHDGAPILGSDGSFLIRDTADFLYRLGRGNSPDKCGNCYNSPIWSMYRFYEKLPEMTDIYQTSYFMPRIPMDVMIVTHQRDHYKHWTKNKPALKNWTAADFADHFKAYHEAADKMYRISAMAPKCPKLIDLSGEPESAAPENAYQVLTERTQGRYYVTGCDFNMREALEEYANNIALRAKILALSRIKLKKTPISTNTIQFFLDGVEVPGNTGAETDKWYYNASTNEVIIRWKLFNLSQVKPGTQIRIVYRVS